jgi:hypothetical protein
MWLCVMWWFVVGYCYDGLLLLCMQLCVGVCSVCIIVVMLCIILLFHYYRIYIVCWILFVTLLLLCGIR